MKTNKSSYEDERAFQSHQAASEILTGISNHQSTSSPHHSSGPGSTNAESDFPNNKKSDFDNRSTRTISIPESYLHIPAVAGNYITNDVIPERRSSARRVFSICCVFDLLFIGILWTIIAINHYGGLQKACKEAIVHFHYRTSMFDIILLSLLRSLVLIIHYWVIVSQMQITIALTTTLSTVYVFVKLIFFERDSNWNTFETYSLLLISFILCWVEVWLFETKVLKVENQVSRILRPKHSGEKTPLLGNEASDFTYSAFMTPAATIPPTPRGEKVVVDLSKLDPRGQCLYSVASDAFTELNETVMWPDGWTTESEKEGITVYSRAQQNVVNRLFLSESFFFCSLEDLFEVLYTQFESTAEWNSSLLHTEVAETISPQLDLVYAIGVEGGAGLIKSRDFLTLRYWLKERDMYYIVSRDISDPVKPVTNRFPRGFNGPCGYVFFPSFDGSVKLTYVVNCDLKLPYVPQKVITSSMVAVVHDFHSALRTRMDDYLDAKSKLVP